MPLISVILPVYNTEKYIAEAVHSILDQTLTDFELLVINDASTDKTLEILEGFTDPRLKIINNPTNSKVVRSLNKGLDLVQGEFIARMDADDICYPDRFEKQVAYLKANPTIDICGSWVKMFGKDNYILTFPENHDDIKAEMLFKNIIVHPSIMFRAESLKRNGYRYNEEYPNAEDYGLWVETIDKLRYAIVPQILLKYRVHGENVSVHAASNASIIQQMNYKVYKILLQRLGVSYNEDELLCHYSLGFRSLNFYEKIKFLDYLTWMLKIVRANNKNRYFNKKTLRNVIINNIIFLCKRVRRPWKDYMLALKILLQLFNLSDLLAFVLFKIRRRRLTQKRLELYNEAGAEYW